VTFLRWLGALIFVLTIGTRNAHADGVVMFMSRTGTHLVAERTQNAVIIWRDGFERLLLDVELSGADLGGGVGTGQLLWIVPIPASEAEIRVDALPGYPVCFGQPVKAQAIRSMRHATGIMALTQLWTIPLVLPALLVRSPPQAPPTLVETHFEKNGVAVEVIAGESSATLTERVKQLGGELPEATRRSFERHVGPQHAFVLYRIADFPTARLAAEPHGLALSLEFPSRTGYFPLAASATVPGSALAIRLVAAGFVEPVGGIPPRMSVDYVKGNCEVPSDASPATRNLFQGADQPYTVFNTNAEPSALVGNLEFVPGTPQEVRLADFFVATAMGKLLALGLGVVVFGAIAVLATLLATVVWPARTRPSRQVFVGIGLLHIATVVAPLLASLVLARRLGVPRGRAFVFVAFSSLNVALLLTVLATVMALAFR